MKAEKQAEIKRTASSHMVSTPSLAPVYQAPAPTTTGSVQSIIIKWANYYNYPSAHLLSIASCESGFSLTAYNPSGATGLFQFKPATFASWHITAGAGGNIYSADDQARTAAYMFSHGQASQWECK